LFSIWVKIFVVFDDSSGYLKFKLFIEIVIFQSMEGTFLNIEDNLKIHEPATTLFARKTFGSCHLPQFLSQPKLPIFW